MPLVTGPSGSYFYPVAQIPVSSFPSQVFRNLGTAPTQIAGMGIVYTKSSDGLIYYKDQNGNEYCLADSAASSSFSGIFSGAFTGSFNFTGSSVDRSIAVFNGTNGKSIKGTNVIINDSDEISGYRAALNKQTTNYNLTMADSGKIVEMSASSIVNLFLPNFLSAGFGCSITQLGSAQVLFSASAGAVLRSYTSLSKSAGQNAVCSIYVTTNTNGTSAVYILGGNIG